MKLMDNVFTALQGDFFSFLCHALISFFYGIAEYYRYVVFNFLSDEHNVYPVTEQYGAQNGYTVQVLPLQGLVELRASYFSPHTENKVCTNLNIWFSNGWNSAILCKQSFMLLFKWVLPGWQDVYVQIQPGCCVQWCGSVFCLEWDLLSLAPLVPQRGHLWGQLHGGKTVVNSIAFSTG